MPKKIWHELPGGAMYRFKEQRYEDMVPTKFIIENFPKEEILKITDPDSSGRKPKMIAKKLNAFIVRAFWAKVVSRLMESDTMQIDKHTSMYIGVTGKKGDGRQVKYRKRKLNYLHEKLIYGVVLNGFFHDYYFRMPSRRRMELLGRLQKGQTFIT